MVDLNSNDAENQPISIPDWQKREIQKRTEEYLKNPSIGQDFYEAMEELENELNEQP
jgi:hypothetical protein